MLQILCGIFQHQTNYALSILHKYTHFTYYWKDILFLSYLKLHKKIETPLIDIIDYQGCVRQLFYLTKTIPNIGFATSLLSQYMHDL